MPAKKVLIDRASIAARSAARLEYVAAPMDALFGADTVAVATGNTPKTLEAWRSTGKGPAFVRMGRSVRYRKRDVESWIAREGVRA